MDPYVIDDPRDLAFVSGGQSLHRISIYTPFERAPTELRASELRLAAHVERAAGRLRERGVSDGDASLRVAQLSALAPDLAPARCHCGCRIVGHGVEKQGTVYCCAHCALREGVAELRDRA